MNPIKNVAGVQQQITQVKVPSRQPADVATAQTAVTLSAEAVRAAEFEGAATLTTQSETDFAAIEEAVEKVNQAASNLSPPPQLKFEPDEDRGVVVIKVLDRVTGEVIRQLPPEAVIEAAEQADDGLPSLIAESV